RAVRTLDRLEPAHEQQPAVVRQVQPRAGPLLGTGSEYSTVYARRDYADPMRIRAVETDKVSRLLGRGRQDAVGHSNDPLLPCEPHGGLGAVAITQGSVLHLAQRVEGSHVWRAPDLL